jgi:hypothetical protein
MTAPDALTGENTLRRMLVLTAIIVGLSVVTFVSLRLYEGIQVQRSVAETEQHVLALEAALKKLNEIHGERINAIESWGFGEVTSTLSAIESDGVKSDTRRRALDAWLLKRDTEMRARLRQLESGR